MPEYLAPGVYVEEVSFRSKSIEGVSTTTTGFVGPARCGPTNIAPDVLTSLSDFEHVYGDGQPLDFKDAGQMDNFLWHAARAFFAEGGKRLYVVRTFLPQDDSDGYAHWEVPNGAAADDPTLEMRVQAAWPGAAGNRRVRLTVRIGQNVLATDAKGNQSVSSLQPSDVVWIGQQVNPPSGKPYLQGDFYLASTHFDPITQEDFWVFTDKTSHTRELRVKSAPDFTPNDQIRLATLAVTVFPAYREGLAQVWEGLALDPTHQKFGAPDSFAARFQNSTQNLSSNPALPITIVPGKNVKDGLAVVAALGAVSSSLVATTWEAADSTDRSFDIVLAGGNDGQRPTATEYEGTASPDQPFKTGLKAFEDIEDISIVAAPGSTFGYSDGYHNDAMTVTGLLIGHAERMRYRIAVLDAGEALTISQVREMRAKLDSKYAAFYYPWVRILDPITRRVLDLPPSGFVAGIYARNDVNRAVYKAPANEVVTLALGFEQILNKGQQDVLNPEGINCFRFFEGRGFLLWGARTISSDPEWKYVNLRRYFAYLERSIDRGTQWAVFEPNGEALWANVRRTIEDFFLNEWQNGALLGSKPEEAYFVRCDRSTMTQNDLDNGRLVCLIGVAPLRPAEFVIFRIGQWTADKKK
jgi:phage tail sheath protein FI